MGREGLDVMSWVHAVLSCGCMVSAYASIEFGDLPDKLVLHGIRDRERELRTKLGAL